MLTFLSQTVHYVLFMDPQISLFSNFFIKNGSYGTIYTFKNYFATVISAIRFQFQQNKSYPNRPQESKWIEQNWAVTPKFKKEATKYQETSLEDQDILGRLIHVFKN